MAIAAKRINATRSKEFQDRNFFYLYQKAQAVFDADTPDADDLLLAKAVFARTVNIEDVAMICALNASIGSNIDSDTAVPESSIEYVWLSTEAFHNLALSYKAAGIIGG